MVCLLQMVALPWAGAAAGDLTLASTNGGGTKGNGSSFDSSVSADGTAVAFISGASNLDPGDTDTFDDVYVKDLVSGTLTLASASSGGTKANGSSRAPSLSADGTRVAFESFASNLDPGDTDTFLDVFVKDLASGTLTLASTSSGGTKGGFASFDPSLSADGTTVAFASQAPNLDPGDTDATVDVFVKDLASGTLTLASTSTGGTKANNTSIEPSLSADGTAVAFGSQATNLDPGDTDTLVDVYVKDLVSGTLTLASTSTGGGTKGNGTSRLPSLSSDGTAVAFHSDATNLDPGDTDAIRDVYVKDVVSGALILASTSSGGIKGNLTSIEASLSADGTAVAFDSGASNLDPGDTDTIADVFVKDLVSGTLALASTNSGGTKGNGNSDEPSLSADGTDVAFATGASNLDPGDTDTTSDIYVKELAGGPEPITVTLQIKKSVSIYNVTVITDQNFDASTIDVSTVCFGDSGAPAERDCTEVDGVGQLKDVGRDGDLDMLLQFEAAQTGIDPGDTQACLTGQTTGATPIEGCGAIKAR